MCLDFLQIISPGDRLKTSLFDFYVFGRFDAIKVIKDYVEKEEDGPREICSLHELHLIGKHRREEISEHFDIQPMHLYSHNDSAGDVFCISDYNSFQPLVLTLIQLDDCCIVDQTPDELINKFKSHVEQIQKSNDIDLNSFEVFFCLGEPDIVIVFRDNSLSNIGRILYLIRLFDCRSEDNGISVLSVSSYCAFPKVSSNEVLRDSVEKWIKEEDNIKFLTFFDTSYGWNNNIISEGKEDEKTLLYHEIVLSEWDYICQWDREEIPDCFAKQFFKQITEFNKEETVFFRPSYSIPVIKLKKDEDLPYMESRRNLRTIQNADFFKEYEADENEFTELSNRVEELEKIYGSSEVTKMFCETISSIPVCHNRCQ